MPHIAIGQTFGLERMPLCVVDATGHLYNPKTGPTWQIVRVSDGSVVLGPQSELARQSSKGLFYPKAADGGSLTAPTTMSVAAHRIEWSWTDANDVAYTLKSHFDVVAASEALDFAAYCSIADIRRQGISLEDLTDEDAARLIEAAQVAVDEYTRQTFSARRRDFRVNGNQTRHLPMGEAIVGIESIYTNDGADVLPDDAFIANVGYPRASRNPYIELADTQDRSIYEIPAIDGFGRRFLTGVGNQRIIGVFGFLDEKQQTPHVIRDATLRIAVSMADKIPLGRAPQPAGDIVSEKTDDHSISYTQMRGDMSHTLLGSRRIISMLKMFRAPMTVDSPSSRWP